MFTFTFSITETPRLNKDVCHVFITYQKCSGTKALHIYQYLINTLLQRLF